MAGKDRKEITSIEELSKAMEKTFGAPLLELGDGIAEVEVIPTGIPSLDLATGVGGLPRGRIIEIFGPEGAGKTTVAVKAMATAQKMAGQLPRLTYKKADLSQIKPLTGRVGMLDVEHAFTPAVAQIHGLQMGKGSGFFFDQPNSGEEALQKLEMMVNSNLFDIIVVDSVAGLTTLEEEKKDIGETVMAGTAQLMSSALKKLVKAINKSRTVVIFINQIREKPAVMYGSPETTPGGRALKFYASMRIRVSKGESIMEGSTQVGHRLKMDIRKNKVAPPFEKAEIDLYYRPAKGKEAGFDTWSSLIEVAQKTGVVELRGSQYQYVDKTTGEIHKAQGLVKWKQYLEENPHVYGMIMAELFEEEIQHVTEQDQQE